nr:uncharacterized protein LOC117218080 [Megalopta genalis]
MASWKNIQDPKKREMMVKVMRFVAFSHKKILLHYFPIPDYMDISVGDQVHDILFTSYTLLRLHNDLPGATSAARVSDRDFKIIVGGDEHTRQKHEVLNIVNEEAVAAGIPFAKYDQREPSNWYGIANTLLSFLGGHALRREELRLGHSYMPVKMKGNRKGYITLSRYGICDIHHTLCEGVSYPPEKRAPMSKLMGPLAVLLCYMRANRISSPKWTNVVKRTFVDYPHLDDVMQIIKGDKLSEKREIFKLIANVALMVGTNSSCGMFPPPAAFSYIFTNRSHKVGTSTYDTEDLLKTFDFTYHGAFAFYKIFMSKRWKIRLNGATDTIAKQVCYHSMFGTYKEDLGILSQITNLADWCTRQEMKGVLRKVNTEGDLIEFEPVKVVFYSELAQEYQTNLLRSISSSVSERIINDIFFNQLTSNQNRVLSSYRDLVDRLKTRIMLNNKCLEMGTSKWRRMEDITPTSEGEEVSDMEVEGTGKYFLSIEQPLDSFDTLFPLE